MEVKNKYRRVWLDDVSLSSATSSDGIMSKLNDDQRVGRVVLDTSDYFYIFYDFHDVFKRLYLL